MKESSWTYRLRSLRSGLRDARIPERCRRTLRRIRRQLDL